jgi:hypothetical protein
MVIHPEVIVTPDTPTIKFREPREQVDLSKELPRILNAQGWGCGTYFNVQFLNHEKTKLLACGRFVVIEETESLHTSDANPYQPMTKTMIARCAEQIGDWWTAVESMAIVAPEEKAPEPVAEAPRRKAAR